MSKYRQNLPQLNGNLFLTDGGLETTLIFHDGLDLPLFAAFDALTYDKGREALTGYFATYAKLALQYNTGVVLESATWRASTDWAQQLSYSDDALDKMNREAIALLVDTRNEFETAQSPIVISGCVGPRSDGYNPSEFMTADEAEAYHSTQIKTFSETEADMIAAITMTYVEEAIGITRAAQAHNMPVTISFTVETDGKLPTGQTLKEAIELVDKATDNGPAYYMINCAHPSHFDHVFDDESWLERIAGLRANASTMSHAELDEAEELDDGNPVDLGQRYQALRATLVNLNIVGGCCGTDHRHIEAIAKACLQPVI